MENDGTRLLKLKKLYMDKHFYSMKKAWEAREFPPPNEAFLPPDGLVVVEDSEIATKFVCGAFLFKTNANIAIIGHMVSDKEVAFEIRDKALDLLIAGMINLAHKKQFEFVAASTNLPRLMERFEKHGLIKTDVNVSNFGRMI